MVINQYEVYLIERASVREHEIRQTCPCVVLSPNEMNHALNTVLIAPMTTKSPAYPTRMDVEFNQKKGWIVLDRIQTLDKSRLIKKLGKIEKTEIARIKKLLQEMLID